MTSGFCEAQALCSVVLGDVLLHIRRLFRAFQDRGIAGDNLWKDACRCNLRRSPLGHVCIRCHPQRYGVSIARFAATFESLVEHHLRRGLYSDHDCDDAGKLVLLYLSRVRRDHTDGIYRLLRVDLA